MSTFDDMIQIVTSWVKTDNYKGASKPLIVT